MADDKQDGADPPSLRDALVALVDLRERLDEQQLRLLAHRHLISEMFAVTGDLDPLDRLAALADRFEAEQSAPAVAAIYRSELDAVAERAAAIPLARPRGGGRIRAGRGAPARRPRWWRRLLGRR
jgi:hypothetical protein